MQIIGVPRTILRSCRLSLVELSPPAALRAWEDIYNTIRPHQALGYLTPAEYSRIMLDEALRLICPERVPSTRT